MKYWLSFVAVLCASCAWAVPEEYNFISVLSQPIASFGEVKTTYAAEPTTMSDSGAELNIGSRASTGGAIYLNGPKGMKIDKLNMEDDTKLSFDENVKWLLKDELHIYPAGNVKVGALLVNNITLNNNDSSKTLQAEKLLLVQGGVMDTGTARSLTVNMGGNNGFVLQGGPTGDLNATPKQMGRTSREEGFDFSADSAYYPISTGN